MHEIRRFLFVLLTHFALANSEGISCYQCSPTNESYIAGVLPCLEFDWSQRYEVSCPWSTLCLRKTYTIPLGHGNVRGVEMGCAPQKRFLQDYNRTSGKWISKFVVANEIYKDGCFLGEDIGRPGGPAEYCYCSYHLCNGSNVISKISYLNFVSSLVATIFYLWVNFL